MKDMSAHDPSHILMLLVVLEAQTANRLLNMFAHFDLGQMGQKSMMVLVDILFQISVDEDYVLPPEHHEAAPQIVHEHKAVAEVIWRVDFYDIVYWLRADPYDYILQGTVHRGLPQLNVTRID